jgi:peptide-methionine (R)-S-oxide reductase
MKSDAQWKQVLTPEQYAVLRERGTEAPFTGDYLYNETDGTYTCVACGSQLFASQHKFDAGCGWPSFYNVINSDSVKLVKDTSHGMKRVEVRCKKCDGHLGHVFNDAPDQPTGMRFCINSVALGFTPEKE